MIAILGSGQWGTALGLLLSQQHPLVVWGRNPEKIAFMQDRRQHPALSGSRFLSFPSESHFVTDWESVFPSHQPPPTAIFIATNVAGLKSVCQRLAATLKQPNPILVLLCKGFSAGDGDLPQQVVKNCFLATGRTPPPIVILSGPSFAQEVAQGLPFALTAASEDGAAASTVQKLCEHSALRVYTSDDVLGTQIGGAVKNILAIACGIADGAQFGANARAALLTRGLAEMLRFGLALGAREQTLYGLSGLGDLVLTATGDLSRNRQVGLQLAKGLALAEIEARIGLAEGVKCVEQVVAIATKKQIEMPVAVTVARVLFHGMTVAEALRFLLSRSPKSEFLSTTPDFAT